MIRDPRPRPGSALLVLFAALSACYSHSAAKSTASRKPVGVTTGLAHPESVRYDSTADVYYISNINGDPSAHDNNGSIEVVSADSFTVIRTLVHGGPEAQLSAPKGLALSGDTLWVADIDTLRAFDTHDGHVIATIDLVPLHASFLNDVAIGGDGAVYVTDSGTGDSTQATGNVIYRVSNGHAEVALAALTLAAPNGIAWDAANGHFLLASGGPAVQTWTPGQRIPLALINGPGDYDGIEPLPDGRILVTSWADSALHVIRDGIMSTLIRGLNSPADIGVDTKRNVVGVPRLLDNRVEYFAIE